MSAAKKRGLGRGLDALLSAAPKIEPNDHAEVKTLPVTALEANRFQPRADFNDADLEELTASIEEQGVIQPIVVAPKADGGYTIVAGERRWRASKKAGLGEVPVIVRKVDTDQELLELALVENLQRADLNPVEEAEAYGALRETFNLSQEQVAKRVGKSRSAVTNSIRLLRLPSEVLDMLREGSLTAGQARPLLGIQSAVEQLQMARRALKENLSSRDLEQLIGSANRQKKSQSKSPSKVEVHTAAAAEKLTQELQTKVEIKRRGERGWVQIHFHSEEELMRIYDRLVEGGS